MFWFNGKKKKLDCLNVVRMTYMTKLAIRLVLIPFDKYKNKLKNQRLPKIKMYNYQIVQSYFKN